MTLLINKYIIWYTNGKGIHYNSANFGSLDCRDCNRGYNYNDTKDTCTQFTTCF